MKLPKIAVYKENHASIDKDAGGLYVVRVYKGNNLHDKVRCDDYRQAMDYYKAFRAIAAKTI